MRRASHSASKREIGIDGVGAVSDQQAVVVHLARFACFEQQADSSSSVVPHQMVVNGTDREQRTDRDSLLAQSARSLSRTKLYPSSIAWLASAGDPIERFEQAIVVRSWTAKVMSMVLVRQPR